MCWCPHCRGAHRINTLVTEASFLTTPLVNCAGVYDPYGFLAGYSIEVTELDSASLRIHERSIELSYQVEVDAVLVEELGQAIRAIDAVPLLAVDRVTGPCGGPAAVLCTCTQRASHAEVKLVSLRPESGLEAPLVLSLSDSKESRAEASKTHQWLVAVDDDPWREGAVLGGHLQVSLEPGVLARHQVFRQHARVRDPCQAALAFHSGLISVRWARLMD